LRHSCTSWFPWIGRLAALLAVPILASACGMSQISNPFSSSGEGKSGSQVSEQSMLETAKADTGAGLSASVQGTHCPQVVAWPHDRLLTVYQSGHNNDNLFIVHRGEITKMSRECQLYSGRVVVKYGFAGRVLLGPKGRPGIVTLSVSIRASGPDRQVLARDTIKITTTIVEGNPVGYFSMVKEISFPMSVGTRPEDYKIFVAFRRAKASG
jgi:hypothetical protein